MVLDAWDDSTPVSFDRQLSNELCSLHFPQDASCVLVLRLVGVGKTILANRLGHIAARRQPYGSGSILPVHRTASVRSICGFCRPSTAASSS